MTTEQRFLAAVEDYLETRAGHSMPGYLEETLARTARTAQRPWWSSLERWLPMDTIATTRLPLRPIPWRVLVAVALIALLTLAILAVGSQRRLAPPFGIAGNGSIIFERDTDIWAAGPDGSDPHPIVTGATTDLGPWLAGDGSRVGFVREVTRDRLHLVAANVDGSGVVELTREPLIAPDWWDWSPAADLIVVLNTIDGRRALSMLSTDGSGTIRRLPLGDVAPDQVLWVPPDGRQLIFRGDADASTRTAMRLYRINVDGSGLEAITPPLTERASYNEPRISPDGTRVTYWNWEADSSPDRFGPWIHVLDLRTGQDVRLAFDPQGDGEFLPRFSPDGTQLLFEQGEPARLALGAADGTGAIRPIGPAFDGYENPHVFEFSPDGTKVTLTFERGPRYLIDVATGSHVEVEGIGYYPTWQRTAP